MEAVVIGNLQEAVMEINIELRNWQGTKNVSVSSTQTEQTVSSTV